jgi:hypothetical protein
MKALEFVDTKKANNSILDNLPPADKKYVYRVDSELIPDFEKNLKTYYHNKDFTLSGRTDFPESTGSIKGVYTHNLLFTALYATGSSEGSDKKTRYVAKYAPGKPTVWFDRNDVENLKNNKAWLTIFDGSNFVKLPSGEYFSSSPGKPLKQIEIDNPFQYITKQGWQIKIVNDLKPILNLIRKLASSNNAIKFGAEGMQ